MLNIFTPNLSEITSKNSKSTYEHDINAFENNRKWNLSTETVL